MGKEEEQIFYNTAACSAIVTMGFSVGGIIIGLDHAEATCSNSFMKLQTWLLVWGIVSLVLCLILAIGARIGSMKTCQVEMFLASIFNLIFTIIGAVVLWRDSVLCRQLDPPLYRFSMAIIILTTGVIKLFYSIKTIFRLTLKKIDLNLNDVLKFVSGENLKLYPNYGTSFNGPQIGSRGFSQLF